VNALIFIIILAIALAVIAIAVGSIAKHLRRAASSVEAQAIKEIAEYISENGMDFTPEPEHPRLVSNMNKIYLPKILKDFPEFNWEEMKQTVNKAVEDKYSDNGEFEIEQTVISRYEKLGQAKNIYCESQIKRTDGEETKYGCVQSTLSYTSANNTENVGEVLTLKCENCGANLTRTASGEVVCEYCGGLTSGAKIWRITDIFEK
jgi:hypothetical protein